MMEKKENNLYGKGILLRPMVEEDTDRIVAWRNRDFVRENFIYRGAFTREGHQIWIETMIRTGKVIQFMICPEGGEPVGSVYLRDIDNTHHKAEYGIFIGEKEALGKGFGTEAARLTISYAFEELGLHKVMLRVLADNERAKKSYEKAGFVQEGYLKDEVFLENQYKDVLLMAIINQEA